MADKNAGDVRQQLTGDRAGRQRERSRDRDGQRHARDSRSRDRSAPADSAHTQARHEHEVRSRESGTGTDDHSITHAQHSVADKHMCSMCNRHVVHDGGVVCGRSAGRGCGLAVCWRCMKAAPAEKLGAFRITKSEFKSLGTEGWWMHEGCMDEDDRKAYELVFVAAPVARQGLLQDGQRCGTCRHIVAHGGGVFCGRRRPSGDCVGCGAAVCWRCMIKTPDEKFGGIRTSKLEFESLGSDAWWMHEPCMHIEDKKEYYGEEQEEEEEEVCTKSEAAGEKASRFEWE